MAWPSTQHTPRRPYMAAAACIGRGKWGTRCPSPRRKPSNLQHTCSTVWWAPVEPVVWLHRLHSVCYLRMHADDQDKTQHRHVTLALLG